MNNTKKPLVSILIINWNGGDVILATLKSIVKQKYVSLEIIVVDNASTDGSSELIESFIRENKSKHKNIVFKFIINSKNVGFAKGNNIAFQKAKGKYILLLNSDAEVSSNFLHPLVSCMEKKLEIAVVQPAILFKNSPFYKDLTINSVGSYFTKSGILYHYGYGKKRTKQYLKSRYIFSANGACMLIRKSIIEKIGLFDNDFFTYFEETDFCIRVLLTGSKIFFEPASTIYHIGGASSRKFGLEKSIFHSTKNRFASYLANFEVNTLMYLIPLQVIVCLFQIINFCIKMRFIYAISVAQGLLWNVTNFQKILKKRKIVQNKIRTLSDRKMLEKIIINPRISYYLYLFKGLEYYKDSYI